ncbi:multidrug efflux SMR transporter [Mycobacterium sp. SMC-4]|uniref:DMT family transporter n=1 Tax=Mycobacterium sp. SMC-4 TaxID=2857059 RepID=UPI0021B4550A|nr:SMR family transporter [Mycobacterium sp. SMC-4]UXA17998.1 QacE family quaternary ammonium compound efflux SMR transporter [Mycobacterium sp. SMC-4]
MAWLILIGSGLLEAVWAVALGASDNFRRLRPTVVFAVAMPASLVGLAIAMGPLPTGTAYAVWVGVGASVTVLWAMFTRRESASTARVALLVLLVTCVVGLKVVS